MTPVIDHAACYVSDLAATREFYVRYLGATSNDGYHNPTTGLRTFFLSFGDGSRLELMTRPGVDAARPVGSLGWIHLAFRIGSVEAVDAPAARMREDGVRVLSGPRRTGDGYYEACVLDPEGNEVELVA